MSSENTSEENKKDLELEIMKEHHAWLKQQRKNQEEVIIGTIKGVRFLSAILILTVALPSLLMLLGKSVTWEYACFQAVNLAAMLVLICIFLKTLNNLLYDDD